MMRQASCAEALPIDRRVSSEETIILKSEDFRYDFWDERNEKPLTPSIKNESAAPTESDNINGKPAAANS